MLTVKELDEAAWREACAGFQDFNYCQEWSYATAMAEIRNSNVEFLAFLNEGQLVGLAAVRIRQLPLVPGGFALVSKGPLVLTSSQSGSDESTLRAVISSLQDRYVRDQGLCLWVDSCLRHLFADADDLKDSTGWEFDGPNEEASYRTYVLDVAQDLDDLRMKLDKKWRRHLKLSEGRSLEVDMGSDADLLGRFDTLFQQLQERKTFEVGKLPEAYYSAIRSDTGSVDYQVMIARLGDQDLAGVVLSLHGEIGVYLLGASSDQGLETDASYHLQWKAIELCQSKGIKWYDLGGVDIEANPGVERFKRRMGGLEVGIGPVKEFMPTGVAGLFTKLAQKFTGR